MTRRLIPYALAIATASIALLSPIHAQNLYVGSQVGGDISEFTDTNGSLDPIGQVFTTTPPTDNFYHPSGMAFDATGNLFVAEGGTSINYNEVGNIMEYKVSDGILDPIGQDFADHTAANGLNQPTALAFNAAGDLFVTNFSGSVNSTYGTGSITKFSASGGSLSSTSQFFSASGLSNPTGMAFDSAGDLFVSNETGNHGSNGIGSITEFFNVGGVLNPTGHTFYTSINGQGNAFGLAFDASGNLYTTLFDGFTGSILKFNAVGGSLSSTPQIFSVSNVSNPTGLAFDSAGNLFVANITGGANGDGGITEYSSIAGVLSPVGRIVATSSAANGLYQPVSLAFSPTAAPEPSAWILLGIGALALGLLRARRRRIA